MIDQCFTLLGIVFLAWLFFEAWQYSDSRDRGIHPTRRRTR